MSRQQAKSSGKSAGEASRRGRKEREEGGKSSSRSSSQRSQGFLFISAGGKSANCRHIASHRAASGTPSCTQSPHRAGSGVLSSTTTGFSSDRQEHIQPSSRTWNAVG